MTPPDDFETFEQDQLAQDNAGEHATRTTHLARRAFELWCGADAQELPDGEQWTDERYEADCDACLTAERRNYEQRCDYDGSYREHAAYLRSDR